MRSFVSAALLAAAALAASAQESQARGSGRDEAIDLGKVEVLAQAYSPAELAPAASLSVVTARDIERRDAASVAEALEATSGLWLRSDGPAGARAMASIGGSSSNQVLVVLDGLRLNDSRQGGVDLAQIPTEGIEKIEVLRGGASAAYGADALGGVIVITTKKSGEPRLAVSAENRSYPAAASEGGAKSWGDGQKLGLEAGLRLGTVDLALAAHAARASNGYDYASDGEEAVREHAAFWNCAASVSAGAPLSDGRLSLLASVSYQDAESPGSIGYPTPDARQRDRALRGSLGWSSDALADGALAADLRVHGVLTSLEYANHDPWMPQDDRHDTRSAGLDLRSIWSLLPSLDMGFGSSILYEAARSPAFDESPEGQPTRFSAGAYVEPEYRVGDMLRIKPALRYDWNDNYAAGVSAMLGIVLAASEAVDLRLCAGRSYRAPTFNDLYYVDAVWNYSGNPDLKPESAWSGELGADMRVGALSVSASARARYVSDLIKITPDFSTMENVDAAFFPSLSVDASYSVGPASVKAGYEYLYPLDLSGDKKISDGTLMKDLSRHTAKASADFAFGPMEAGLALRCWSERVVSDERLEGTAIVDLSAAYKATKSLRLYLGLDNLFDAEYQLDSGYPQPGISLKVGAKLSL